MKLNAYVLSIAIVNNLRGEWMKVSTETFFKFQAPKNKKYIFNFWKF